MRFVTVLYNGRGGVKIGNFGTTCTWTACRARAIAYRSSSEGDFNVNSLMHDHTCINFLGAGSPSTPLS